MLKKKNSYFIENSLPRHQNRKIQANKKNFQTKKKTTIKPIKQKDDKHISDRLKHTSIHVKGAV